MSFTYLSRQRFVVFLGLIFSLTLTLPLGAQPSPEVQINERNLPPPLLDMPIHECALAVHVRGVLPGAVVHIFAGSVEVGHGVPFVGEMDVRLSRPLVLHEVITAKQTVASVTTDSSNEVTVDAVPPNLSTPVARPPVYECGQVVPVDNLTASTHVEVFDNDVPALPGRLIGTGENAATSYGVVTSSLKHNHHVIADQVACPAVGGKTLTSSASHPPLPITPSPLPVPPPEVDQPVSGTNVVTLHKLLPGAQLSIFAGPTLIGSGKLANSSDNWFPLDKPVPPGHPSITAVQALCTPSAPSNSVIATDIVSEPTVAWPICAGSRVVSLYNTIPGAIVQVFWLSSGSGTPISIGVVGGVLGKLDFHLGKGAILSEKDVIFATQTIGVNVSGRSNEVTVGCGGGSNVVTQHNDNGRTGAYLSETKLTPVAVRRSKMIRLFKKSVSGHVRTQTLYVHNVQFASGMANGIFAVTTTNRVYAFDGDNGNPKWGTDGSIELKDSDPARAVALGFENAPPVIDPVANRMYVLFRTGNKDAVKEDYKTADVDQAYWLVALDIRTGGELGRTRIAASIYQNDGTTIAFSAKTHTGHPALLLDRGSLYLAFGSRADSESDDAYYHTYHGWVFQYRATDLSLERAFCTSPNPAGRNNTINPGMKAAGSGIWQGGVGLAADPDGNVFFLTGNGRLEPGNNLYGDSFLKLATSGTSLSPVAYSPAIGDPVDDVDRLEAGDADMGSGGPLVIPGTNLVIGGGKTGFMYLLDRTSMQLKQRLTAATNLDCTPSPSNDCRSDGWEDGPHLHGSPTFWGGTNFLYIWGEKDYLKAYLFDSTTGKFGETPVQKGPRAEPLTMPGGMLSLSANGNDPSSGVLWAIISTDSIEPGKGDPRADLIAFDARTLEMLWSQPIGHTPHWAPPTIAEAKVFVTNLDGDLMAFGLGQDPNDIHWTPYVPKFSYKQCQACHSEPDPDAFVRKRALLKYYIDEASVFALPAETLHRLGQPSGMRRALVLEGNGIVTYKAEPDPEHPDKLVWKAVVTTAKLRQFQPDIHAKETGPTVSLSEGPVWTASDGSKLDARPTNSIPSPVSICIPWTSYEVTRTSGQGILAGLGFVQRVHTHAGAAPVSPPKHVGETVQQRFTAEYWFYRHSD